MNYPLKKVIPIKFEDIDESIHKQFAAYIKHYVKQYDNHFFLVDGELYTDINGPEAHNEKWEPIECLLKYWKEEMLNTTEDLKPLVRRNGEFVFECVYTGDYETSVRSLLDGRLFEVHSG
jgi:hypothetical protein